MPRAVPPRPRSGRLFLGAALALGAIVALSAWTLLAYLAANHWVDHTLEVRADAHDWVTAANEAETDAHAAIAGDASAGAAYRAAVARADSLAAVLRHLVADNPPQAQNVETTASDLRVATDDLAALIALAEGGRRGEAASRFDSPARRAEMERVRADTHEMRLEEERLLVQRRAGARFLGILVSIAASLLVLASAALLGRAWRREGEHERVLSTLAIDARRRLQGMSELAAALSATRTRLEVVNVIVEHGMRLAGADSCTLYELDDAGTALNLVGDRGVSPDVLEKIRVITETSGNPETFATMKSGLPVWAETPADYQATYPALAELKAEGPRARAFWSAPLVAEGRSLGLLGVGFYEPRRFSEDERAFVGTLTRHCAQALLRASRREREDEVQRLLATTLRSIGDAVIATDAAGKVTFMNPIAESLTGWGAEEARGRALDEVFCIFSEQTHAVVESPVAKVLRAGTVVGLANHTVLRSKAGGEIPIDDSGAPIVGEGGHVLGVVLVFRDATQEKRERERTAFLAKAGEALASSIDYEATLATVARLAVPALADWCAIDLLRPGAKGREQVAVAHVDERKVQFARALGERYPQDPNAPTGVPQVLRSGKSELYADIPPERIAASARDEEHGRMLRDLQLRSAMVVPLRVRERVFGAITFVYAESGRRYTERDLEFAEDFARRAAMAIENANALKDAEDARAQERLLRGEAERASSAKDDFLATVSHELRTPLNAILGWTMMGRRRKLPEDVDRALAIVERNARTQAKLIEDVLDVSRIISGKLGLNLGPASVADAVSAAVETVGPAAEAKEIRLSVENADASLSITADADRLQQIVWNLLSNAVKFTPKGGSVGVRAYREGSDVCIRVSDTGEGIRRDVLPLVFDRFQQADASITRRHGGLGLGLAIVKQLVAAHGGTVTAESEGEGKGATFLVRLPARAAVPAVRVTPAPLAKPHEDTAAEDAPRLDGLRLLLVDDEEDVLELVSEVLRERGAEVYVASSAAEGLERFGSVRPHVIVSDIGMPDVDGFSFIRQVRALSPEDGGGTPAVALTAYARSEDAQRAFAAGYQRHLAKPVEPADLASVVANLGGRTLDS